MSASPKKVAERWASTTKWEAIEASESEEE
jgi:hypothetical protein